VVPSHYLQLIVVGWLVVFKASLSTEGLLLAFGSTFIRRLLWMVIYTLKMQTPSGEQCSKTFLWCSL